MTTGQEANDTRPSVWIIVPTTCNPTRLTCDALVRDQLRQQPNAHIHRYLYAPEHAHTPNANIEGVKRSIARLIPGQILAIVTYDPLTIRAIEVFAAHASIADKVRRFTFTTTEEEPKAYTKQNTRLMEIFQSEPLYTPYADAMQKLEDLIDEL